jgi:hypothetical protein
MMLIAVGAAPFGTTLAILDRLEPELVNGVRPLWWRAFSLSIYCAVLLVAPVIVRYFAREIVRTDGWLGGGPASPTGRHASPSAS